VAVEPLRARSGEGAEVVFVVGGELSFVVSGVLEGADHYSRIRSFASPRGLLRHLLSGGRWPGRKLDGFLARAAGAVRSKFAGRVTYASGPWERVSWAPFDVVAVNYYRDAANAKRYRAGLRRYLKIGKPLAITEFGCSTYAGADAKGSTGWAIVDTSQARRRIKSPRPRRDEGVQARYLGELVDLFDAEGLDAAFAFNFAGYNLTHDPAEAEFDLDMASFGVVKVLADGRRGTTYRDLPWEPKLSFAALAGRYGRMAEETR
jgi:hypothetical protein